MSQAPPPLVTWRVASSIFVSRLSPTLGKKNITCTFTLDCVCKYTWRVFFFFALLSSVSQVAAAPHVHRLRGKVVQWYFLFFFAERKAVQESYLLVNLNDMFLQQNQTKKQWKWGRRNERRGRRKKEEQGCEESEWVNKNVAIGIINSEREDPMFSMIFSQFRSDVAGPAATFLLLMQRNGLNCYFVVLNT